MDRPVLEIEHYQCRILDYERLPLSLRYQDVNFYDVNLFRNSFEQAVTAAALLGSNAIFPKIVSKIHTPELTTQGMAAKAWVREKDGLYLYKVGKKELAASRILDLLQLPHVAYEKADDEKLTELADQSHINKIRNAKEEIVKYKIISSDGSRPLFLE